MAAFVKKSGIGDKVKNHKLIIPGYSASESGGLEETSKAGKSWSGRERVRLYRHISVI